MRRGAVMELSSATYSLLHTKLIPSDKTFERNTHTPSVCENKHYLKLAWAEQWHFWTHLFWYSIFSIFHCLWIVFEIVKWTVDTVVIRFEACMGWGKGWNNTKRIINAETTKRMPLDGRRWEWLWEALLKGCSIHTRARTQHKKVIFVYWAPVPPIFITLVELVCTVKGFT